MSCSINGITTLINGLHLMGDLILCGTARITSCPGHNVQIVPATGSITQIGDAGSTSHNLVNNDDLFISGKLEVDGPIFFDNVIVINGTATFNDNQQLALGSSSDVRIDYSTNQLAANSLVIGLDNSSKTAIITTSANKDFDHAHLAQPNPTTFIHSQNQTTNEWVSSSHNQTDALQGIGKGGHVTNHGAPVDLADDASFTLPNATAGFGFLIVGNAEEYAQFTWTNIGVVTLVNNSANVVAADIDTNFCIFDTGTFVTIRNRLGSAKKIVFDYHYTTP